MATPLYHDGALERAGFKPETKARWRGPCPAHGGRGPNCVVWPNSAKAECYSQGCDEEEIVKALGIPTRAERKEATRRERPPRPRVTRTRRWAYRTASGATVYAVRRDYADGSKSVFTHPKGRDLSGVHVRIFEGPEEGGVVVLPEGEKDAEACVESGFEAASWIGGSSRAGKSDYSRLAGRNVVAWGDDDSAGRKAIREAMAHLRGVAASVRLVREPGGETGKGAADYTVDERRAMIEAAEPFTGELPPAVPPGMEHEYHPLKVADLAATDDPTSSVARLMATYADRLLLVWHPKDEAELYSLDEDTGIWRNASGHLRRMFENSTVQQIGKWWGESVSTDKEQQQLIGRLRRNLLREPFISEGTSRVRVSTAYRRLEAWRAVPEALTQCDFSDLDPRGRYLGCANGVVDLQTGKILTPESGRLKLVTRSTKVAYTKGTRHRDVDALFAHMDDEARDWILRAVGYGLQGLPSRRFYLFVGSPGGGKSTLLAAIVAALGEYGATMPEGALSRKDSAGASPELFTFLERRIVVDSDLSPNLRPSLSVLKRVSGGDPLSPRRLYEDFSGEPRPATATLFLSANIGSLPRFDLADPGLHDRLRVLPYPQLPPDARRRNMRERVTENPDAQAAMLSMLIDAAVRTFDALPEDIPSVQQARQDLRAEAVGLELHDWLASHVERSQYGRLLTGDLWDAALRAQAEPDATEAWGVKRQRFTALVTQLFGVNSPEQMRERGRRGRGWKGIRLVEAGTGAVLIDPTPPLRDQPSLSGLDVQGEESLTEPGGGPCKICAAVDTELSVMGDCVDSDACSARYIALQDAKAQPEAQADTLFDVGESH